LGEVRNIGGSIGGEGWAIAYPATAPPPAEKNSCNPLDIIFARPENPRPLNNHLFPQGEANACHSQQQGKNALRS
jgi:hypothetical protein